MPHPPSALFTDQVADAIVARLEKVFPGLKAATIFRCVQRVLAAPFEGEVVRG